MNGAFSYIFTHGGNKNEKNEEFFKRKNVTFSPKKYFVDAMGSMALGLFASLLIGTIFDTIGTYTNWVFITELASFAKQATGAALGVAIAYSLQAPPLVLLSAAAVGIAGNNIGDVFMLGGVEKSVTAGPAGAFVAVLVAVELGKLVSKETHIDILVTPTVTIVSGVAVAKLIGPAIAYCMYWLGYFVNTATEMQPVLMGIIISVVVGMVLTLPISSAALCAMIGISGIAGGAAGAGCCAQMVGFAVISFSVNGFSGIVAQGIGTSMLQMGNIVKNPRIWIAPTLASAITGPISTAVFGLKCVGVSAGMGTCGLVSPINMIANSTMDLKGWVGILLVCFVLPAVLSWVINFVLLKLGWVKKEDYKLAL